MQKKIVALRILGHTLALTIAGSAAAADEEAIEPVVVTATRIPTPLSQIASSITVITAADIADRQARTLPDALKTAPGLNLVQEGGPGGQTSVFLRGTNSNHVKVVVDGIDVSDPSSANNAFDFGHFLTHDIAAVEVLRGPQSGLYGSDAIGGVINIITKAGAGPAQFTGSAEGGSFGTFNQLGTLSGSVDGFHYSANLEHLHTGETPVTPLDLLIPGERRIDDYYDNLTAATKLGYEVSDRFDLGLVARYTDTHLRFTGENEDDFPLDFPDTAQSAGETTQYYARLTAHHLAFGGVLDHTLGLAYSNVKSTDSSPDLGVSQNAGNRVKVDWQGNVRLADGETLVLGAEHQRDAISAPIAAGITIDSGYGELQSVLGYGLSDTVSIRYDDNDRFGGKETYRVAPAYLIEPTGTKLKASVGSGFKAPTLSELFQSFAPFFFANPNLLPESSFGYDLGFEQQTFRNSVTFGATYFHNHLKDLIDANADGTTYVNIGHVRTDGAESFISYRFQDYTARLDYTYTEAIEEGLDQELLRRPKHKASLRNTLRPTQSLTLDATVLVVGTWIDGNRDFSIPRLNAPSYATVDLAANYELTPAFAVYARIENLFDRHYENPVGFLQPSFGVFAGVKVKL